MNKERSPFPKDSSSRRPLCALRVFPSHSKFALPLTRPIEALASIPVRVRYSSLVTRHFPSESEKYSSLSPFPGALTSSLQLIERTTALSPAFAPLTNPFTPNPFVCHSYKKTPGGGYTSLLPRHRSQLLALSSPPRAHAQTPATPFSSWRYFITCGYPVGGYSRAMRSRSPSGRTMLENQTPSYRYFFTSLTSLLQIFTQLHSFEYGTRLIRYPDFTPVTT
jgi:hypothetical protein